jgi:hypothetical protein
MAKLNMKLSRVKSKYESEGKALESVCKCQQLKSESLKAVHTSNMYIWELIEADKTPTATDKTLTVEKTPDLTLQDAKKLAMKHFNTFEGNIKIVDQDKTQIILAKVRE